jgi:pilus assembly protein CpaE
MLRGMGMSVVTVGTNELTALAHSPSPLPDIVLVDLRRDRRLLATISLLRRQYPSIGIAIVCTSLEPSLMLEAMRAGVTECVAEPVTRGELEDAIKRIVIHRSAPATGRVFSVVGAKGGVGGTTIAVNLAIGLAKLTPGHALLIDLHVGGGDAAVFLGAEPRFSIVEAIENTHRLDEAFLKSLAVHTRFGLDLLAGSSRPVEGVLDAQRVRAVIEFAVRYYRYVVIDADRGSGQLLEALDSSSAVLLIANQELPTIRKAHRLAGLLRQRYGSERIRVVLNRVDRGCQITPEDVQKAIGLRVAYSLPSEYRTAVRAMNTGEPLGAGGSGKLATALQRLVKDVIGETTEGARSTADPRMFEWLTPRQSQAE